MAGPRRLARQVVPPHRRHRASHPERSDRNTETVSTTTVEPLIPLHQQAGLAVRLVRTHQTPTPRPKALKSSMKCSTAQDCPSPAHAQGTEQPQSTTPQGRTLAQPPPSATTGDGPTGLTSPSAEPVPPGSKQFSAAPVVTGTAVPQCTAPTRPTVKSGPVRATPVNPSPARALETGTGGTSPLSEKTLPPTTTSTAAPPQTIPTNEATPPPTTQPQKMPEESEPYASVYNE
jgi:hypothetical protein